MIIPKLQYAYPCTWKGMWDLLSVMKLFQVAQNISSEGKINRLQLSYHCQGNQSYGILMKAPRTIRTHACSCLHVVVKKVGLVLVKISRKIYDGYGLVR